MRFFAKFSVDDEKTRKMRKLSSSINTAILSVDSEKSAHRLSFQRSHRVSEPNPGKATKRLFIAIPLLLGVLPKRLSVRVTENRSAQEVLMYCFSMMVILNGFIASCCVLPSVTRLKGTIQNGLALNLLSKFYRSHRSNSFKSSFKNRFSCQVDTKSFRKFISI